MQSINPYTGELIKEYTEHTPVQVEQIILQVNTAFSKWKDTAFEYRSLLMRNLQARLLEKKEELAALMTAEMGKVKREAVAEIEKCASACEYYAGHAASFMKNEPVATEASESYISYQPLGTILAVMPWNFPFWQVFRFLAPALMAGNTGLLKHASNVQGCALAIEQLVADAGFPGHVFRTLVIGSGAVSAVIENPLVRAVTLTGSTPAGKAIAATAGSVLKKTVLELGGSDPYLVLEDADVPQAALLCARSRLLNAGQSCISAKRFIVSEKIYEAFKEQFIHQMQQVKWGDPEAEQSGIGPLARTDLRDSLHSQVEESRLMGARVLLGGFVPEGKGAFYPPTVLENVVAGMPAHHEELFGPVAVLYSFHTEEEAFEMANASVFGLGAAIFTSDPGRIRMLAEKNLEAGCVFINDFVRSDPRLPFGGVKESGYGRELSQNGLHEFLNIKTIVVK